MTGRESWGLGQLMDEVERLTAENARLREVEQRAKACSLSFRQSRYIWDDGRLHPATSENLKAKGGQK